MLLCYSYLHVLYRISHIRLQIMSREREEFRERERPPPADGLNNDFKAFIGGISYHIDDEKLREGVFTLMTIKLLVICSLTLYHPVAFDLAAFGEFEPVEAKVMIDKYSGRSRGFGFVWFNDKRSLEDAIDKLHNTELEGRRISVAKAVPQAETAPGTPADMLRRGQPYPRDAGRYERG